MTNSETRISESNTHAGAGRAGARWLPSRPAAVVLLAIDAVLLTIPLFAHWGDWFVFAYMPLLITVALGALMSGAIKRVTIITHAFLLFTWLALWFGLELGSSNLHWLDVFLKVAQTGVACVIAFWLCLALLGWVRFFRGRPFVG